MTDVVERLSDRIKMIGPEPTELLKFMTGIKPLLAEAAAELVSLRERLPEGMKDCTITFHECDLGHGWLSAKNWVQHGCPTCAIKAAESDRDAAVALLTRYFKETPLGHQPHMIAHEAETFLDGIRPRAGEKK